MLGTRFFNSSQQRPTNVLLWVALLTVAIMPLTSSAAFVDHGTYMSDTTSGRDWLKLDQTVGMSYNDVSAQLAIGGQFQGWSYADVFDVQQLWLNAGASFPMTGWSAANNGVVSPLLSAWGSTQTFDEARVMHTTFIGPNLAVAIASDDPNQSNSLTQDFMSLTETTIAPSGSNPIIASALYRTSVPEPNATWLVATLLPWLLNHRGKQA